MLFRYRSLAPIYYQGAAVVLIVFDVTKRDTFVWGATRWVKELCKVGPTDALYALVGNKAEGSEDIREVSELEGRQKANRMGALYFETSAKSGYNICELFKSISRHLDDSNLVGRTEQSNLTALNEVSPKNTSCKLSDFCRGFSSKFRLESHKQRLAQNSFSEDSCCGKFC